MSFSRAQFAEHGYVILRGVIEESCRRQVQAECEALVEELAQRLVAEGKVARVYAGAPFEQRMLLLFAQLPDQTP